MDEAVGKSSPYSEVYVGEAMPERNCSEIYDYSENLEKTCVIPVTIQISLIGCRLTEC
jgi:hypothetical protein